MSRSLWKGLLSTAVLSTVLSLAPNALALGPGSSGPAVANLQSALGIPVDGLYGRQTASAVAAFQRSCGLAVDGVAGPQTLSALSSGRCGGGGGLAIQPYPSQTYYPVQPPSYYPSYPSQSSSSYYPVQSGDGYLPIQTPGGYLGVEPANQQGPYVVAIPGNNRENLSRVRSAVPGAFIDGSQAGGFINAGGFSNFNDAQRVANRLRGLGFNNAQVTYLGSNNRGEGNNTQ